MDLTDLTAAINTLGPAPVTIGSTIWVFDENHRVYARPPANTDARIGRWAPPIWREHWMPRTVVAETSRSWVLNNKLKVPKRGADPSFFAFSEADIARQQWVHENRHRVVRAVERCVDYDVLQRVAAAVGAKP